MHEYFSEETSPGRLSVAYQEGMEPQHATHAGKWDRNPMTAAMLEIRLSMTGHALDQVVYDTHLMWGRVCGGVAPQRVNRFSNTGGGPAGYRVPTNEQYDPKLDSYRANPDALILSENTVELTDFAPLVAFGSLETLRSQRMSTLSSCNQGLAPEDAMVSMFCAGEAILGSEMTSRENHAPFTIQRNIWCNPHKRVTVEETFGNPEYFDNDLLDTELKERYAINNLAVLASQRGEEDITGDGNAMHWSRRSLRGWVYVTSSGDRHVRAGMYRLADLPLFRSDSCAQIPAAQCSDERYFTERQPAVLGDSIKGNDVWSLMPGVPFLDAEDGKTGDAGDPSHNELLVTGEARTALEQQLIDNNIDLNDLPPFVRDQIGSQIDSQQLQSQGSYFSEITAGGRRLSSLFANIDAMTPLMQNRIGAMKGINLRYASQGLSGVLKSVKKALQYSQVLQYRKKYLNVDKQVADNLNGAGRWRTGKEALLEHRCNRELSLYLYNAVPSEKDPCTHAVYSGIEGCMQEDLPLISDPSAYGVQYYFHRFLETPSPSPPPPPPTPHPPPSPPSPQPPPSPPDPLDQTIVMERIRDAEEQACTTVYFLSQTTRCERLAIALTQPYLVQFISPPTPPPIGDGTSPSPPPTPPPSPRFPEGFTFVVPPLFTLSTYRYPLILPDGMTREADGYYIGNTESALAAFREQLSQASTQTLACTPSAPLACATEPIEAQCINGGRRCGTSAENALNPYLDAEFALTHDSYLWGLRFSIPRRPELTELFVGPKRVQLYGPRNTPIPCFEGDTKVSAVSTAYHVDVVCAPPTATDDALRALATVWRMRLTLTGGFRQIWLDRDAPLQIIERPLQAAGVEVLALPPSPMQPPPPPTVAKQACSQFFAGSWLDEGVERREHEPCGMTREQCCDAMHERGAARYEIDDQGCCALVWMQLGAPSLAFTNDTTRAGKYTNRSGTGF